MKQNTTIPKPLPRIVRFERLAYGMFLHWGLYSQLGCGEWVKFNRPIPRGRYNRLARTFTAKDFDAAAWARLARAAGMRYIVLTTRHHEGFSLYDTRGLSKFDAPNTPAARDLVSEFVDACRKEGIVPFFYHTTIDWQWWPSQAALPCLTAGRVLGSTLITSMRPSRSSAHAMDQLEVFGLTETGHTLKPTGRKIVSTR